MNPSKNLYRILGVRPDATPEEIKAAYREKIRKAHTDRGGKHEDAAEINAAYAILESVADHAAYRAARAEWGARQQAVFCVNCGEANRIAGFGTPVCGQCKAPLAHPDQFLQFKRAAVEMANEVGSAALQRLTIELKRRLL
jgi:hypothetical protein